MDASKSPEEIRGTNVSDQREHRTLPATTVYHIRVISLGGVDRVPAPPCEHLHEHDVPLVFVIVRPCYEKPGPQRPSPTRMIGGRCPE